MFYHVCFVTKYRSPVLEGEIDRTCKSVFEECFKRHCYNVLAFESNVDHVHMLVEARDNRELSAIVRTVKAVSAKVLRERTSPESLLTPHFRVGFENGHFWARRYNARVVPYRDVGKVVAYILRQREKAQSVR